MSRARQRATLEGGSVPSAFASSRFERLRAANLERMRDFGETLAGLNVLEWAAAMAGEAGEACNEARKMCREGHARKPAKSPRLQALAKEIADTIIYSDLLAARCGLELWPVIVSKFNETSDKIGSAVRLSHD